MKKIIKFGAMALTIGMLIYSCEKEEIESKETTPENKEEVNTKSVNKKPITVGFFELELPSQVREVNLIKDSDLEDYDLYKDLISETEITEEILITREDKKGREVEGRLKVSFNSAEGKITQIEASDNLRRETGLSRAYLVQLFNNSNIDINEDLIELASDAADCHMICQDSYRENSYNCQGDPQCMSGEWTMYRRCSRGCTWESIKGWFNRISF